jgi:hypothetical protein
MRAPNDIAAHPNAAHVQTRTRSVILIIDALRISVPELPVDACDATVRAQY